MNYLLGYEQVSCIEKRKKNCFLYYSLLRNGDSFKMKNSDATEEINGETNQDAFLSNKGLVWNNSYNINTKIQYLASPLFLCCNIVLTQVEVNL